jgi:hypothetical protein
VEQREILVRDGKGRRDRRTMLPEALVSPMRVHVAAVKNRHQADLAVGGGAVALPDALRRKYPAAPREWPWQWLFPATRTYVDRDTGDGTRITISTCTSSLVRNLFLCWSIGAGLITLTFLERPAVHHDSPSLGGLLSLVGYVLSVALVVIASLLDGRTVRNRVLETIRRELNCREVAAEPRVAADRAAPGR